MSPPQRSLNFYSIEELEEVLRLIRSFKTTVLEKAIRWSNIELDREGGFGIDQGNIIWHDLISKAGGVLKLHDKMPDLIRERKGERDFVLNAIEVARSHIEENSETYYNVEMAESLLEQISSLLEDSRYIVKDVSVELSELKRDLEKSKEFFPRMKRKFKKLFRLADQQASMRVASRQLKK